MFDSIHPCFIPVERSLVDTKSFPGKKERNEGNLYAVATRYRTAPYCVQPVIITNSMQSTCCHSIQKDDAKNTLKFYWIGRTKNEIISSRAVIRQLRSIQWRICNEIAMRRAVSPKYHAFVHCIEFVEPRNPVICDREPLWWGHSHCISIPSHVRTHVSIMHGAFVCVCVCAIRFGITRKFI